METKKHIDMSIFETILRIFLAVTWAAVWGTMSGPIAFVGVLAIYPFVTALVAYDPIYMYHPEAETVDVTTEAEVRPLHRELQQSA